MYNYVPVIDMDFDRLHIWPEHKVQETTVLANLIWN